MESAAEDAEKMDGERERRRRKRERERSGTPRPLPSSSRALPARRQAGERERSSRRAAETLRRRAQLTRPTSTAPRLGVPVHEVLHAHEALHVHELHVMKCHTYMKCYAYMKYYTYMKCYTHMKCYRHMKCNRHMKYYTYRRVATRDARRSPPTRPTYVWFAEAAEGNGRPRAAHVTWARAPPAPRYEAGNISGAPAAREVPESPRGGGGPRRDGGSRAIRGSGARGE